MSLIINIAFLLFIIFSLAYVLLYFFFIRGIEMGMPELENSTPEKKLSIVVAVKNEQRNIERLINKLTQQTYPKDLMEIIIVDNESRDKTYELLQKYEKEINKLRVFTTKDRPTRYYGKKSAMDWGIRRAGGDIILTTEVNCKVGENWAQTMVKYFNWRVDLVVGFSGIKAGNSFLSKWQAADSLQLMTVACATMNRGNAWGGSKQNLAFRKDVYKRVGGFNELEDLAVEYDSLFTQVVRKKGQGKIIFAQDPETRVETAPINSLSKLISQRVKWAMETKLMYKFNFGVFLAGIITFGLNLLFLLVFILSFFKPGLFIVWACFGLLKYVTEFLLFERGAEKFDREELKEFFPYWFFTHIPYVIIVGGASLFRKKDKI